MVPLNGILDFSTFLQRENPSLNDDAKKELANNINKGAIKLKSIAEKFSLWDRLLKEETFKPNQLFEIRAEQIYELVVAESRAIGRSLEKIVFSADGVVYKLFGKEKVFLISIRELIENALKFSDSTSVVAISITESRKKIMVSIANQSLVATTYELQRYKAFSQLHHRKIKNHGVGLGLEIARNGIAKCMGSIKISKGEEKKQVVVAVILNKPALSKNKLLHK